jgi:tetratricopeptide (TPR) repeat protein
MSYLVLHIDLEFIVGAVCIDNGNSYPITNGNDDLLWLYFFNDPHQNRISFGKENRTHFNNRELNYYGKFFDLVENEQEKFTIRGIQKQVIELFEYSGLLKILKEKYKSVTHETPDDIPTLITFSHSIGELSKQKTVEYFKNQGFKIDSYTIPLSELVCYYPFSKKDFIPANGNAVLLLAATNTTLYLMKLVFSNNYFMIDGEIKTCKGKGVDPRKIALVKFVVNEINNATGALSSEEEKEDECEKMEPKAEEWLKRIDAQLQNRPFRIVESFSKMQNARKEVFVRKENIENDTGHYIQELMDIFDAFKSDNVRGDIAAIFLLGDCFQNSLVKGRFNKLIHNEKLFVYVNKDIQNILSVYPKIDFKRYIDKEARSKALAEAEEKKKAEQRALEDRRRKAQEEEDERIAKAKKAEENRKEVQKLYERSVELQKEGKLSDALANMENVLRLDPDNNVEYRRFHDKIKEKIEDLNNKTEKFKSWLKDAEDYNRNGDLDKALKAYKHAQEVFDSAEIRRMIVEIEDKIKKQEKNSKILLFINNAELQLKNGKFDDAINSISKALEIDPANKKAKETLQNIYTQQHKVEIDKTYKSVIAQADTLFKESSLDEAIEKYNKALEIKPNDKYCTKQLQDIEDLIQQRKNQEKVEKIIAEADRLFANEKWENAKSKYGDASNLCPQDKDLQNKIKQCEDKIRYRENEFKRLLSEATLAKKDEKLKEALSFLEKALDMQPDNSEVIERINTIKGLQSKANVNPNPDKKTENNPKIIDGDDFLGKKTVNPVIKTDNDFIVKKTVNPVIETDNDFIVKKPEKSDDDDDFLKPQRKINNPS